MIKFGTGGWRAIIGDEFTRENVQKLTQALMIENKKLGNKPIVIGYDRRFLSDVAAQWAAEVIAGNDAKVYLINRAIPTPITMFAVKSYGVDYGLAVTASHNPALYNGIKLFTSGGRDATEVITEQLERNLKDLETVNRIDFQEGLEKGIISVINPSNEYVDSILDFMDIKAIRDAQLSVLVDPMHGVSKTSLTTILATARCDVDIINDRHDTLFGGKLPSPSASTLHKLEEMVREGDYNLGIATDGDADRIGIIDEKGNFIHPNLLISLLYFYLLEYKQWTGPVVRNLSTTHLLDRIAHDHHEECIEVPVGFKHISSNMEKYNALIGGESSGGLTIRGHISGKDGIFAAVLLVEMISVTKKPLGVLVQELFDRYGQLHNLEYDYRFTLETKNEIHTRIMVEQLVPEFHLEIEKISYMDGLKVYFTDGAWISARFSGTEPLLRIFAEANTDNDAHKLVETMEDFLNIKPIIHQK